MIPPWLSPVSLIIAGSNPMFPLETGQLGNDEGHKKEGHAKSFSDTVTWDGCRIADGENGGEAWWTTGWTMKIWGGLLPCHIPGVLFYEIIATTPVPSSSIPRPSKAPITNQDESSGSAEVVVQSPLTRIHRSAPRREKTAICSQLYQSWKGVGLTQKLTYTENHPLSCCIILYQSVWSSTILYLYFC